MEKHGHLNVDFRYNKCKYFGGWDIDMSQRYKDSLEGKVVLSPGSQQELQLLSEAGFGFNVFPGRFHRVCYYSLM